MNHKRFVAPLLAAVCLLVACSKKSPADLVNPPGGGGNEIDSSTCQLSGVNYTYEDNIPYYRDAFQLTYDSLGRVSQRISPSFLATYEYTRGKIIERAYINTTVAADSLMVEMVVFTLNADSQIVKSTIAWYNKPKNDFDYSRKDSTAYEYDAAGYLLNEKVYAYGTSLQEELKYTYADSNLTQKLHIYYGYFDPNTIQGTDTINYVYDNTAWLPEAKYLYEITTGSDIRIGRASKNNVTGIRLQMHDFSDAGTVNNYKTMDYTYTLTGPKLRKVNMKATTTQGYSINTEIIYNYKCD